MARAGLALRELPDTRFWRAQYAALRRRWRGRLPPRPGVLDRAAACLGLLLHPACGQCGKPSGRRLPLCAGCQGRLPANLHACAGCALPLPASTGSTTRLRCGRCLQARPPWEWAAAPLLYQGPGRELMHSFKENGQFHAGAAMANLMRDGLLRRLYGDDEVRGEGAALPAAGAEAAGAKAAAWAATDAGAAASPGPAAGPRAAPWTLVPVPSSPRALQRRGFHPAAELAAVLGPQLGLRTRKCLAMRRATEDTKRLAAAARRQLAGKGLLLAGKAPECALLVDDVMTTGATCRAAASLLRGAGCRRIAVATAMRTP